MNLYCDNFLDCHSVLNEYGTLGRARVKGWHVYDGKTQAGADVVWVLCPGCVGQRGRLPKAPEALAGQEELF